MTVMLGFVPSPEGRAAARFAIEEAVRRRTTLTVVNASRGQAPAEATMASHEELKVLQQMAKNAGIPVTTLQPAHGGSPAEQLLSAVESHSAEVLVIGLRRRSQVGKLILGSTALTLLSHAPCPVSAIKADKGYAPGV
ncbi:universal stress protein [Zafaria cholistanensis]|uniref:Universal stress protein n=1 Tax=Zafaria cholistanensis TaxID=1682741 RepID=A0A5A7NRU7_9MICC|nr:universal stress protein [Zafaria cholistanensis]GER23296.1 universal stress protein [Zafaria cholistanensis]